MHDRRKLPIIELSNGFRVPVALISLDDASWRRELLVRRGLPAEWVENYFPAIDLRNARQEETLKFVDQNALQGRYSRSLRPAEIGCALSHIEVARWLCETEYDLLLVFEDDIVPQHKNFFDQIRSICEILSHHALRENAFFCHLGQRFKPAMRLVLSRNSENLSGQGTRLFLHCDSDFDLWQTHAYIMSRAGAQRLIREEGLIRSLADDWSGKVRSGVYDQQFLCFPKVFGQDEDLPSTIQDTASRPAGFGKDQLIRRILNSISRGALIGSLCASVTYRVKAKLSHLYGLFPYLLR